MIRYCFDLDNTICTTKNGDYHKSIPIDGRIKRINKLYDAGHIIIIDSARGSETDINWVDFTKNQLAKWGLKYHVLRTGVKFFADYYIDDSAINSEEFFNEYSSK